MLGAQPVNAQMLTGYSTQAKTEAVPAEQFAPPAVQTMDESVFDKSAQSNNATGNTDDAQPVDFQADSLVHNEQDNTIQASGNVMLVQAGRILRSDEVFYDLNNDQAIAKGHVVLNEENGDIFYADRIELRNNMKDGLVQTLRTYLSDGSRFIAESGTRSNGTQTKMSGTIFTPCKICEDGETPAWQIRASEVHHDQEAHTISYKHAKFDFFGVPLAYVPYFSHPDGSIKQKSGMLAPSASYKSRTGLAINNRYYWAIGPDQDATIGLTAFTEQLPMVIGEYRKRWEDAQVEVSASTTYAKRVESDAGADVLKSKKLRSHLFADGLWNIDDKWRAGTKIAIASDDQYLNQYDFSSEDVLENKIYAERFENRDYLSASLIGFHDTRTRDDAQDQPMLLPEVIASFQGDPGDVPVLGGSWGVNASYLGLRREGEGQDVDRVSAQLNWDRRLVSRYGFLTDVNASVRGDIYHVNDSANLTGRSSESESRIFPQMHVESSYPLAKSYKETQVTIEPLVALTVAPNIDVDDSIPNEDSQDVQIDASNLFQSNRFPGYDRIEDQSRVTYGLRTGIYGHKGSYANVFLGQSYRLDEDDNPFPSGSGLDKQESDVVGQISANYLNNYFLDYRFQLSSDSLRSQRHEVDASMELDRFNLSSSYLFAKALEGTDISESREQIRADAGYYFAPEWRMRSGAIQDLGDTPGLREAYVGLDYLGECLSWSLVGERTLTNDSSGDESTEILFTVGLKNLGEFEQSSYKPKTEQACGIFTQ